MRINGELRIAVIALTLLLTVGILFGGYSLYNVYGIEKPVEKQLTSVAGVSTVAMEKKQGVYRLEIKLGPVENLQETYVDLHEAARDYLADEAYELQILDDRNERLTQLYAALQPGIQQSLARHEYVWLDSELDQKTAALGMEYRLLIDEEHLYLHLQDGQDYFYAVLTRPAKTGSQ